MTDTKASAGRFREQGLTLIELLISLVIALVVIGAVIVSIIGSGKGGRFQEAYSQMNEDAQIAFSILSRDLQMAGYSQPTGFTDILSGVPGATPTFALQFTNVPGNSIFGCDTGFSNPVATPLVCGTGTVAAFEVAYEADFNNTVRQGTGAAARPSDCLGNSIAGTAPWIARNRYYISTSTAANTSGRPELYCASDNASGIRQPLVENIEGMVILYGVSLSPPGPGVAPPVPQIVRYVTATQIASVGAAEWGNVVSVRICLIVRSAERVLSPGGEDTLTYLDCADNSQTSNDGYLRRAYFSTSTIRDRMP
jgi:type IV pilus assembly protein PilW